MGIETLLKVIMIACPTLFAITVHEIAHGWAANRCGDSTARALGRLTLNPIKHIDPLGTIILPTILYMTGGIIFGWAKPVPVNYNQLKNKRRDMALVALAGPAANLLMLLLWAMIFSSVDNQSDFAGKFILGMAMIGMWINTILMVLNLLPIPPLDGSQVMNQLLPKPYRDQFERIAPWGMFILIALALSGLLFEMIMPITQSILRWVWQFFAITPN